jgi:MoaA/NifB/PqqE/SkfB family radical SAM enzyme
VIDSRLFDWYGIDTEKNLKIKDVCARPFDTVLIDKNGSCFACECTAWLPQSIGNLHQQDLSSLLSSTVRKHIQSTVQDKSFRLCNSSQCSYILGNFVKDTNYHEGKSLENIRLAIDDSCNLSCPSCRSQNIFLKSGKNFKMRLQLADKILSFLRDNQEKKFNVHIGSDGEPFASLVYRHFMKGTKDLGNIRYSIQTNGLLIKKTFHKFQHIIKNMDRIGISIDGANKNTYEELRRGGSYEKIIENLEFLKKIKNFDIHLHFVVQQKNYKEIEDIIQLGIKFNVDKIFLNKITNWNTMKNFKENAVCHKDHKENKNLLDIIERVKRTKFEKNFFVKYQALL